MSVSQLRAAMEKSSSTFDKEKAQERLSKLSGGVAVFKVCSRVLKCGGRLFLAGLEFYVLMLLCNFFQTGWRSQ